VTVDLTAPAVLAGATVADPVQVSTTVGMGRLQLVVPAGKAVEIHATVGAGAVHNEVTASSESGTGGSSGPGIDRDIRIGSGDPVMLVQARVGFGEIQVLEATP
jgi:hypothetical protein